MINNARALYDGLTEMQKPFVSNYDVLLQAEASYNQIKADEAAAAEQAAREAEQAAKEAEEASKDNDDSKKD